MKSLVHLFKNKQSAKLDLTKTQNLSSHINPTFFVHKYIFTFNSKFILSFNMFEEKLVEKRLQNFRKQARNQQLESIYRRHRQKILQATSLSQPVTILSFPKDNPGQDAVRKVLQQSKKMLLQPFKNEMVNQGQTQTSISIDVHMTFWQQCLFWLEKNQSNRYLVQPFLLRFVIEFKLKYSCKQCMLYPRFLSLFIDLIQEFAMDFSDPARKQIAQWISDVNYITLVKRLFMSTQDFPSPQYYPNIYQIIFEGLNSQISICKQSASFFLDITRYANSTQNFIIYQHKSSIFWKLLQLLQDHCNSFEATYFWPPIYYSLNIYSQTLKQYANSSLIAVCHKLLKSKIEDNIFGSLAILKILSRGEDQILQILRQNLQYSEENWLAVSLDQNLNNHSKIDICKQFFQIIRNFLFYSKQNEVVTFCRLFQKKGKSIITIIQSIWQTSRKDVEIVIITLQCVSTLLILNDALVFDGQSTLAYLQSRNMLPFISKCKLSQNSKIQEKAYSIMDQIDAIEKSKKVEYL